MPIMSEVREALEQEKEYQDIAGLRCKVKVDGFLIYFINRLAMYIIRTISTGHAQDNP